MPVNDSDNLVGLTTGFHGRLHTIPYYDAVSLTVEEAAPYGRQGVVFALTAIANALTARDEVSLLDG